MSKRLTISGCERERMRQEAVSPASLVSVGYAPGLRDVLGVVSREILYRQVLRLWVGFGAGGGRGHGKVLKMR